MDVILNSQAEKTIERIKEQGIVLAHQATTTLNYVVHSDIKGLGLIHDEGHISVGLILHDTFAFTEDGTPLGVLDAQCWVRDAKEADKSRRRKKPPIEQKGSMKWLRSYHRVAEVQKQCPDTMLVSVGDSESDIYELFLEAKRQEDGPQLLVRFVKACNRLPKECMLWDITAQKHPAGVLKIHIPQRGNRKARDAHAEVRFSEVELNPARDRKSFPVVKAWAVYVIETEPPLNTKPVEWMLLSNVNVETLEDAKKRVKWYSSRWGIDVYHRTLKSGCRIKNRQFGYADRIETCLGIDMADARRIFHLRMLGKEIPDELCTVFLKAEEWKALYCYVNKTPLPPDDPPTLLEAVMMIAGIGGYIGGKSDGFPGTKALWRGMKLLDDMTEMYVILKQKIDPHPRQPDP